MRRRQTWPQRLLSAALMAICGAFIAFLLLEWLAGCGEVTHFADGTWRTNECIFLNADIKTGVWRHGN